MAIIGAAVDSLNVRVDKKSKSRVGNRCSLLVRTFVSEVAAVDIR